MVDRGIREICRKQILFGDGNMGSWRDGFLVGENEPAFIWRIAEIPSVATLTEVAKVTELLEENICEFQVEIVGTKIFAGRTPMEGLA